MVIRDQKQESIYRNSNQYIALSYDLAADHYLNKHPQNTKPVSEAMAASPEYIVLPEKGEVLINKKAYFN